MSAAARQRQLASVQGQEEAIEEAADLRGFELTVRNDGQHWEFKRKGKVIDWWPGSGKVAIDKDFARQRQAWDLASITAILEYNKGPVRSAAEPPVPEPVAEHARPVPVPSLALDRFDAEHGFERIAAAMDAAGLRHGFGLGARRVTAASLRAHGARCIGGLTREPGSFVETGGLRAERLPDGEMALTVSAALKQRLRIPL